MPRKFKIMSDTTKNGVNCPFNTKIKDACIQIGSDSCRKCVYCEEATKNFITCCYSDYVAVYDLPHLGLYTVRKQGKIYKISNGGYITTYNKKPIRSLKEAKNHILADVIENLKSEYDRQEKKLFEIHNLIEAINSVEDIEEYLAEDL